MLEGGLDNFASQVARFTDAEAADSDAPAKPAKKAKTAAKASDDDNETSETSAPSADAPAGEDA